MKKGGKKKENCAKEWGEGEKWPRQSLAHEKEKNGLPLLPFFLPFLSDHLPFAMKIIVVTGGNASGLGKGCAAANIGVLLQSMELAVSVCKIEPYLVRRR
jgi:hypothetical protein